jgi:hypothetical protein
MNSTYHPANDEEQPAAMPTDYRALLAITRPLVVAEVTLPSWRGGEICRSGFGIFSEPGDWRPDLILKRGEIFRSHESGQETAQDEEPAAESMYALRRRDSGLQIRICLGMS